MAANNSGLSSTYLFISEKRLERGRRERQTARIIRRRASEEDHQLREVSLSMLHLETLEPVLKPAVSNSLPPPSLTFYEPPPELREFLSSYVLTVFFHWIYKIKYSCYQD